MTKTFAAIAAFLTVLGGEQADAAALRLIYSGNDIPLVSGPPDYVGDLYPAFSGEIVLDEAVFGGSVANQTLSFFASSSPFGPGNDVDGILSWTHGVPLYSVGGTTVSLTFDGSKNLVSWFIDALDGPPDYTSTTTRDFYIGGNGGTYYTDAGTWVTAAIPVPGAGLALGSAGLALLCLRRRPRAA